MGSLVVKNMEICKKMRGSDKECEEEFIFT